MRSAVIGAILSLLSPTLANNVWLKLVTEFQREASSSYSIDQIPIPCTHNAYNDPSNLPPKLIEYENLILFQGDVILQNQDLTMTQQLDLGIRHLQIDAHFIPKYNATWMCHGSDAGEILDFCPMIEGATGLPCFDVIGVEDLGIHTGCTSDSRTWEQGLKVIANWSDAHPAEFIWIDVEDQVSVEPDALESQFATPIINLLGSRIFTNADLAAFHASNGDSVAWPSIDYLRGVNKTLVLSGIGTKFASIQPYVLNLNPNINFPANDAKNFDANTCNGLTPNFTFFGESDIKVVLDILDLNINRDGNVDVGKLSSTTLQQVTNCGFSGCVDLLGDADMTAIVWSWAQPYSTIQCTDGVCPVYFNGKWEHETCSSSNYAACKSNTDPLQWALSMFPSSANSPSCPGGYTFSYPRTPLENVALGKVAQSYKVFLNLPLTSDPSHPVCTYVPSHGEAHSLIPSSLFFLISLLFSLYFLF